MQSKKGLYLIIAFIATILVFFFILFFVHKNTLENGILFTVSFEYENAKDITYNFYNQNGKIEKVEQENSFLLEKTDYNSVKLLRKITKGLKESKEPKKEEGISIYNGQNKRYYLIPYDSSAAEELSRFIIDGYIHAEMKEKANKIIANEIYIYQKAEDYTWTDNGFEDKIIHTYQCSNENCKFLYVSNKEQESILWDNEYFVYNYITRQKEQMNLVEDIAKVNYLKIGNRVVGIELYNEKNQVAYYDMDKKELFTEFANSRYNIINDNYFVEKQMQNQEEATKYTLKIWDRYQKKMVLQKEYIGERKIEYDIREYKNNNETYYAIIKSKDNHKTYEIYDSEWEKIEIPETINGFALTADGNFVIYNNEHSTKYQIYKRQDQQVLESKEYQKVYGVEEDYIFIQTENEFQILDVYGNVVASKSEWKKNVNLNRIEHLEIELKLIFSDNSNLTFNLETKELKDA